MRSATVQEIKEEIQTLKPADLIALCLRLARFKKENKELLTYIIFEAGDEEGFVKGIKQEISGLFSEINQTQLYFAKKSLRKIVRIINKYSRYSGNKQTDLELRLFFCRQLLDSGIPARRNPVISNLYDGQMKKIITVMNSLHADLQYDFQKELDSLQ